MTEYYYEDEIEDEPPAPPPARRMRFNPTRERGADYFEHANRHSRLVRALKFGLPVSAVAGIAAFVLVVQFAPGDEDTAGAAAVVSMSSINVDSKSLVMDKPNISGFEGTRHSYEIEAAQAIQDLQNPKLVTMKTITARIGIGSGATATVNATTGKYDAATKSLVLTEGIVLTTTNGYKAKLKDANVDLDKGGMTSDEPVQISGKQGTINANSIKVMDRGAHVIFGGGVHLVLTPSDKPDDADKTAAADKSASPDKTAAADATASPDKTATADSPKKKPRKQAKPDSAAAPEAPAGTAPATAASATPDSAVPPVPAVPAVPAVPTTAAPPDVAASSDAPVTPRTRPVRVVGAAAPAAADTAVPAPPAGTVPAAEAPDPAPDSKS